jgi:hypothetical protein
MPKQRSPHAIAQAEARKYLVRKYRSEYDAVYRAQVLALGGRVHPTSAERIANLKAQIAQLESKGV